MPDHQAHVFVWGLGAGSRNPSQTQELSRSPLVAADVNSHDHSHYAPRTTFDTANV